MIRNICYSNARQYLSLPEPGSNGDHKPGVARRTAKAGLKRSR
jgi:hypothetical protein